MAVSTKKLIRNTMKALRREFPQHKIDYRYTSGHISYYLDGHRVATSGSTVDDEHIAIDRTLKDARRIYRQKEW
jgi:hypothetical protein